MKRILFVIKNLKKEINNLKDKEYISTNNLDILNKFKKYLITHNDYIFRENGKLRNLFKTTKLDAFRISEFANKIKELDGEIAYKHRYFLANKLGFNWDIIYIYKKNQRNLILKNRQNKNYMKIILC